MSNTTINIQFPSISYTNKASFDLDELCNPTVIDITSTVQLLNLDSTIYSFLSTYSGDPKSKLVLTSINLSHDNLMSLEYNSSVITNVNLPIEIDISTLNDTDIIPNLELKFNSNNAELILSDTYVFNISFYIEDENGTQGNTLNSSFQLKFQKCSSGPVITSTLPISSDLAGNVLYQIEATNNPISYYINPLTLPGTVFLNPLTGLLSGRGNKEGTVPIDIVVTNNSTSTTTSTTITITNLIQPLNPPVITSPLLIDLSQVDIISDETGSEFAYQITATNNPDEYSFTLSPTLILAGFTVSPTQPNLLFGNTATLTNGDYLIPISASNEAGTDNETLTLRISSFI